MMTSFISRFGICPYVCSNRNEIGYCKTTACINPKYNGIQTYYVSDHTEATYPLEPGTQTRKDKGATK